MRSGTVGLLLSAALLASCAKKEAEQQPVVTVQTATVHEGPIQQAITTEAVLFPKNQAAITPKIVAPVKRFLVNRGARVRKGQLLAVLENRDISASVTENAGALEQAHAAYETTTRASLPEDLTKAETDAKAARENLDAQQKLFDSRKALFDQGALPRKDLDQASVALVQAKAQAQVANEHLAAMQAVGRQQTAKSAAGQLASAKGKYEGATAQLSYSEIRSPIDGVVTDRPLWVGETPAAGTPLITIMDTTSVTARAHIPQGQAAQLKIGDSAMISAEGNEIPGKVTVVSPALDPGSTTVEVWVEAANKVGALRPGSTVQLEIAAKEIPDALTIPATAVLKTPEGASAVMVVGGDGHAHQTAVETGIVTNDQVQITKGLKAGQTVVTTGAYGLPDNTQVKTESASQPSPDKPSAEKD